MFAGRRWGAAAAAALALALAAAGRAEAGASAVFQCQSGTFKYKIAMLYLEQGTGASARRQFNVELEASRTSGRKAGQLVRFFIDKKEVGKERLVVDANGDFDADLRYDSAAKDRAGKFPADFPKIKSGQVIAAKFQDDTLATCTLP